MGDNRKRIIPEFCASLPRSIIVSLLVLLLFFGGFQGFRAYVLRAVQKDKTTLRAIYSALADYIMEWNGPPSNLEELQLRRGSGPWVAASQRARFSGAYLNQLPISAFEGAPVLFFREPGWNHGGCFYIAWTPGPDGVFDIPIDDPLKIAIHDSYENPRIASWLINRVYDPSNGLLSSGDIVMLDGVWAGSGISIH